MITELGTVGLKSGETLRVSCVLGPEPSEAGRVEPFLGHKGEPWRWHILQALAGPLDSLETRFYLGEIDGRLVGNVCTFERGGVGILGHVFTHPDHRQKGIADGVMGLLMEEFRRRGGQALTLGTGYGSHAYRLYQRHGFESVIPESGDMKYAVAPDYFDKVFEPSPVTARPADWGDWGRLNPLFMRPGEPVLRNLAYGWFGPSNVEGAFIRLQQDRESGRLQGALILETQAEVPVGFSTLTPAPQWPGPVWQLDLHVHPAFAGQAHTLLNSMRRPEGKVIAHSEAEGVLAGILEAGGFRQDARLAHHLVYNEKERDILLWARA